MSDLTLSPLFATVIFFFSCVSGYKYRQVWKVGGPTYQYWVFGIIAATGLIVLGFVPLSTPN
ncbi:hypothetical protein [Roseobacter sp.]|uniref:hypothetical protein n=1 Tax=Roseobacter sp. TaxID=1907202 RepID=UPI003299B41E